MAVKVLLLHFLVRIAAGAQGGLVVFGDSISCGVGGGNQHGCSPEGFAGQLGKEFPGKYVNYSRGGDMAPDMARFFVYPNTNPDASNNPIYISYIGNNDETQYHEVLDEDHRKLFEEVDLASNAWLAIPWTCKVIANSAVVKTTGTWTADGSITHIAALQSSTDGSTLTFPLESGTGIYIGWRIINGNGGAAAVEIDGRSVGNLKGAAPGGLEIRTINKTTDTIAVNRFAVSRGKHMVRLKVTSASDPKNVFSFIWAGSYVAASSYSTPPPPRVLIAGVIRLLGDAFPNASATVDQWVREVARELKGDGLNVAFVPVRDYVNATTDMFDAQHPNSIGHEHLRGAFQKAMLSARQ